MEKLNTSVAPDVMDEDDAHPQIGEVYKPLTRQVIFMRKLANGIDGVDSEIMFQTPPGVEEIIQSSLTLKQVMLGSDADPEELCVLELETKTDKDTTQTFPLAYLGGAAKVLQWSMDLTLLDPSKIRLAKGKGPVFIIGDYGEEWKDEHGEAEEAEEGSLCNDEEEDEVESASENKENGVAAAVIDRKRKRIGKDDIQTKKLRKEDAKDEDENMEEVKMEKAAN